MADSATIKGRGLCCKPACPKSPPLMRGDFRGVKSEATESHRITISQFNNSTIQPFTLNQSATELRIPIKQFNKSTNQQFNHGTLSPNRGRFCRIARLPDAGRLCFLMERFFVSNSRIIMQKIYRRFPSQKKALKILVTFFVHFTGLNKYFLIRNQANRIG